MIKRKLWLTSLTLLTSATTLVTTISCSTSWRKWSPAGETERPQTDLTYKQADEIFWTVRKNGKDNSKLSDDLLAALNHDAENQILTFDLSKINNQYEFIALLGQVLGFSTATPIDTFWRENETNEYPEMYDYINNLTTKVTLKITLGNSEMVFNWDIHEQQNAMLTSLDNFKNGTEAKAFDVTENGLDEDGLPINLLSPNSEGQTVAEVGASLILKPIVQSLLGEDSGFTFRLSKLVNLPKTAFNEFTNLLDKIDDLLKAINNSAQFKSWVIKNNLDFQIMGSGYYYDKIGTTIGRLRSQFLLRTLKKPYSYGTMI